MSSTQEVKLSGTAAERDLNDSLAEIYSIIITLDGLEKAYIKDSIPETEYTEICSRLLKQYKSNLSDDTVARSFVDLETFKRQWDVSSPLQEAPLFPHATTDNARSNAPGQPNASGSIYLPPSPTPPIRTPLPPPPIPRPPPLNPLHRAQRSCSQPKTS